MTIPEMCTGAIFPSREIGSDPYVVRNYAQGVEKMGFDFILAHAHPFGTEKPSGNNRYTHQDCFPDPIPLSAFLAACTEKVQLITGVVVLPQRETILFAQQAADVDALSNGRYQVGVGVGSNPNEFAVLGLDYSQRGKKIEQQIPFLRELWTHPLVSHLEDGTPVEPFGLNPLPKKSLPIWIGGWAPAVLARAAKMGDGWMPMGDPEDVKAIIPDFRKQLKKNERDPNTFPIMGGWGRRFSTDGTRVRPLPDRTNLDAWRDMLIQWRELGVSHIGLRTSGLGLKTVDEHLRQLETWVKLSHTV